MCFPSLRGGSGTFGRSVGTSRHHEPPGGDEDARFDHHEESELIVGRLEVLIDGYEPEEAEGRPELEVDSSTALGAAFEEEIVEAVEPHVVDSCFGSASPLLRRWCNTGVDPDMERLCGCRRAATQRRGMVRGR